MAAIVGLDETQVLAICKQTSHQEDRVVSPANYNTPAQIVISGHHSAVTEAIVLAKDQGAKLARLIPVSVPAHCSLMKPAAQQLAQDLNRLVCENPAISVINNVDAKIEQMPEQIKQALVRQLYSPVRWVESIQWLLGQGVQRFIECGPAQVLSGLIRRIAPPGVQLIALGELSTFKKGLNALTVANP